MDPLSSKNATKLLREVSAPRVTYSALTIGGSPPPTSRDGWVLTARRRATPRAPRADALAKLQGRRLLQ